MLDSRERLKEKSFKVLEESTTDSSIENEILEGAKNLIEQYYGEKECNLHRNPRTIAAASLYLSSHSFRRRLTQRQVSEIINVSSVTIRDCYHEILDCLELDTWRKLEEVCNA